MEWRGGDAGRARQAVEWNALPRVDGLKHTLGRAGCLKLFILGLAIGIGIGILGGRAAERSRLADYAAIEQMILDRERLPDPRSSSPPHLRTPAELSRM